MSVKPEKLIIGTRGSPLALWQAERVRNLLAKIDHTIVFDVKVIKTSGDWVPEHGEVPLGGNKSSFATEIEQALIAGEIDLAVHSMKDMETVLPDGLVIPYMLPREDVRDAFLSDQSDTFLTLPEGATVGTVSVRRAAFVLNKRPDLKIVPLRGNVHTRIEKIKNGQVDATFLACAGLNRLGLADQARSIVSLDDMLPSVGQGAIGVEIRESDLERFGFMQSMSSEVTFLCVSCERAVLNALGGSCHTPVGVLAQIKDDQLHLHVKIISSDGCDVWSHEESVRIGSLKEIVDYGCRVGMHLKSSVPSHILAYCG